MNNNRSFWPVALILVLIIVLGIAIYYATSSGSAPQSSTTASEATDTMDTMPGGTENTQAVFACDNGESIDAMFMTATTATTTGNSVMLSLSDGRQMTLPQVVSADGARYANADQSVVFWNVGETATITENGTTTYNNCTTQASQ